MTTSDEKTLREYLFREVEIVQDIITRMGTNSFLVKGWAITLIVTSLLITGFSYHHYVALLPSSVKGVTSAGSIPSGLNMQISHSISNLAANII